ATGTRLTHTLALELKRRNKRYGIASACIGGGQGTAILIENETAK
ncbi:MAG: acetyl-CoA C-acyltransferase, partial [Fidelibacterota bacterium]